jgi:hypothetical protein
MSRSTIVVIGLCIATLSAGHVLGFATYRQPRFFVTSTGVAQLSKPLPQPNTSKEQSNDDLRGTDQSPISVRVLPTPKTDEETSQEKKNRDDLSSANWWMVRLTGAIGFIGLLQLFVFGLQAFQLRQTIRKMDEIATGQAKDMRASISEANRAAAAMEGVAKSLELTTIATEHSVSISREIADTQKLVTELSGRAYLSAAFQTAIYQDADHIFEVQTTIANRGNTPAYNVTFRATVDVVPFPIPDDFDFPLPASTAGGSVSFIAPGLTKFITRGLAYRVPDNDIDAIKHGAPPRCLLMWGMVNYEDAFKQDRFLKFAFIVSWVDWLPGKDKDKDGNPMPPKIVSHDTTHHNEAS